MRLALTLALLALPAHASDDCTEDAMLVFDGSGSMAEMGYNRIGEPRIFEARRAVADAIPGLTSARDVGLIIYGPNGADECTGIDLAFPPVPQAAARIMAAIDALQPEGSTPLTASVALAADVLRAAERPATIVIVTDGKETCQGAPCQLAAELAASSLDLTIHVIGFRVRAEHFTFGEMGGYEEAETVARCLADRTGGDYVSTETAAELVAALEKTLGCALLY